MKKVMAMGTFDVLHAGHLAYLAQAKRQGDRLIVVIARDATVEQERGRKPLHDERERLRAVQRVELVDEAVLGNVGDKLAIVRQLKPDAICLGYDQAVDEHALRRALREWGLGQVRILRMSAFQPERYKSSILKKRMMKEGL